MPVLSIFYINFAIQVPVGDRAGSTPVIRTKKARFFAFLAQKSGFSTLFLSNSPITARIEL